MKTLKTILFALTAILVTSTVSIGQNYKSQFNVQSTGQIVNDKGVKLGWIEADGTIKNAKGDVVGKIEKKDKEAELLDKLGKKMGGISEDGTLKDGKGTILFTISTDDESGVCKILDGKGKVVGTVHQNYKQQGACLYHCLVKTAK